MGRSYCGLAGRVAAVEAREREPRDADHDDRRERDEHERDTVAEQAAGGPSRRSRGATRAGPQSRSARPVSAKNASCKLGRCTCSSRTAPCSAAARHSRDGRELLESRRARSRPFSSTPWARALEHARAVEALEPTVRQRAFGHDVGRKLEPACSTISCGVPSATTRPWSISTTRSQSCSASFMWCVL